MNNPGVFGLLASGLRLMKQNPVIYGIGLVAGAASVIPSSVANSLIADLTPQSTEAEIVSVTSTIGTTSLVFGMLFFLVQGVLVTLAVRASQGDPSLALSVDRFTRRFWAMLLWGPFVFGALVLPLIFIVVLVTAVLPSVLSLPLLLGAFVIVMGAVVGSWAVIPALTISNVRLRNVFEVIWNALQNGGLRLLGLGLTVGLLSVVANVVIGLVFPQETMFGAATIPQLLAAGFFAAWVVGALASLWNAEAANIVVGLTDTNERVIEEDSLVYDPSSLGPSGFGVG